MATIIHRAFLHRPTEQDYLERIQELIPQSGTGKAIVSLFQALHEAMRAVDPSIPTDLPSHSSDPMAVAAALPDPRNSVNIGMDQTFTRMEEKIDKITDLLIDQKSIKEWYSTAEVAQCLRKAEFTVREYCRLGQCKAEKRKPYRGGKKQWMISHDEMLRLEMDGPAKLGTFHT